MAVKDHTAPLNFPAAALTQYANESITALRREQTELLALVQADAERARDQSLRAS